MNKIQVVKIGASSLIQDEKINEKFLDDIACDVWKLRQEQISSLLVISGAIKLGMAILGYKEQPNDDLVALQRCACIGQPRLVGLYDKAFKKYGVITSQLLVTYHNLDDRVEEENIIRRLKDDINHDIVTLVNYNDGIDNKGIGIYDDKGRIRVRDNDMLASAIARYVKADILVILTNPNSKGTIGGRYTKKEAIRISEEDGIKVLVGDFRDSLYSIIAKHNI